MMKLLTSLALGAAALGLVACSGSEEPTTPKTSPEAAAPAAQPQAQAPANHPTLSPQQQQAVTEGRSMANMGTVKEMLHAAGYTYMKVDTGNGEPVWIAATMMRVKPGEKVKWADAAVMHNFASKSLHRTFDKILFVSSASVVN